MHILIRPQNLCVCVLFETKSDSDAGVKIRSPSGYSWHLYLHETQSLMWQIWIFLLQRFLQTEKKDVSVRFLIWRDSVMMPVDGVCDVSHHLLWLWDGNSTEELVVAEDLLVSRDQISCRGRERRTQHMLFSKSSSFLFTFQENMWWCFPSAAGCSHRESSWSGTAGPCQTSRATEGSPTAAQRTHNRSPTRPPEVRTECLPPAARGPGTNGSPRSLCSSHRDQLMAQKAETDVT